MTQDSIQSSSLDCLQERVICYLDLFNELIGPQRNNTLKSIGNNFPKFHGMLHFVPQIKKFGSAKNFNGGYLEKDLKTFIKRPAKRTRHTHFDFGKDLINRWSEFQHIEVEASKLSINEVESEDDTTVNESNPELVRISHKKFHS